MATPDIIQQFGPGWSFYLSQAASSGSFEKASQAHESSLERYSNTLNALRTSNQNLEHKMNKIRTGTLRLKRDLRNLQCHMKAMNSHLLATWQANTLTRLIEVIYERNRWKLPGGFAVGNHLSLERETLDRTYIVAAGKIKKDMVRRFGLSVEYYIALQRYDEIVEFRSENPYQTECAFAAWLVAEKENHSNLCRFWGRLFPLCYGRSVEDSVAVF